jgi:hypothetical protein
LRFHNTFTIAVSIVEIFPEKKENKQEDTDVTSQDTIKENSNKVSRPEVPVHYLWNV